MLSSGAFLGRSAWSLQLQSDKMAVGLNSRHAADEEARAEVEVLNSRLERTSQLTKKIQASLSRLESSGKSVQEAIGPIYGNTRNLQVLGTSKLSLDGVNEDKIDERQISIGSSELLKACDRPRTSRAMRRMSSALGQYCDTPLCDRRILIVADRKRLACPLTWPR